MSEFEILRPRDSRRQHAHRRLGLDSARSIFHTGPRMDSVVLAANTADMPVLGMPAPEDSRKTLVTSAISAFVHLLALAAIAAIGYFAEEVVQEIIPVEIISAEPVELPGSNDPAPMPKAISPRATSAAALAAAPPLAAAVPAQAMQAPSLDTSAPTQIDMANVTSQPIAAQAQVSPALSAADIREVTPLRFDPKDLAAPTVDLSGPTATTAPPPVNVTAPTTFDTLGAVDTQKYTGAATASAAPTASGADYSGPVAPQVSQEFLDGGTGGGFVGGNPNGSEGTVPCMQSAYVMRYKNEIERRTRARWIVPMNAMPEDQVTLRFKLDHAGSVTRIEVVEATNPAYGKSALEALTMASPFPPLDDNVRCLSEKKRLTLTFTNS